MLVAAAVLVSCGDDEPRDQRPAGAAAPTAPAAQPEGRGTPQAQPPEGPLPSRYAERRIPRRLLEIYLQTGADLEMDWSLIAAVDQIDLRAGNPTIPTFERVPGIAYSLAAAGGMHDPRGALIARAGAAYADRVLAFAGRLRAPEPADRSGGRERGRRQG